MINDKFKEVFDLSKKLQEKKYMKDYEELSKFDENIGTFEEYVEQEKKDLNKEMPRKKTKLVEEAYISKDKIKKDNLIFSLYLFQLTHTSPIKFDKDYKPLPLKQNNIYEYGAVASLEDKDGYYDISGVFGGIEPRKDKAEEEYNSLKDKIMNLSENELLDEIKYEILKQINC